MGKVQQVSGGNNVSGSVAGFMPLAQGSLGGFHATEAQRQITYQTPGTLSNLLARVKTNSTTSPSTLKVRKNGADGNLSLSIGTGATGNFEDTVNTDAVAAGDELCYAFNHGSAHAVQLDYVATIFEATTNTVTRMAAFHNASGVTISVDSVSEYMSIVGGDMALRSTDALTHYQVNAASTMKNLFVYVSANARGTATIIRTRKNTANGNCSVSIGASATGIFEDTSSSDSLAVDDVINTRYETSTGGGNLVVRMIAVDLETTTRKYHMGMGRCDGPSAGGTFYFSLSDSSSLSTAENEAKVLMNHRARVTALNCIVSANNFSAATTISIRIDGVTGRGSISITASTTGTFEDATHVDEVLPTESMNTIMSSPAGTGSTTIRSIGVVVEELTDDLFVGCVAAYDFPGGSLADHFGEGPTLGTANTPVSYSGGKINDAYAFGGFQGSGAQAKLHVINEYFSARLATTDPSAGRSFTITFWAWKDGPDWNGQGGMVSNWANASGPVQYLCYPDDGSHVSFQVRDASSVDHIARINAPSVDAWHFFVCRYNHLTGEIFLSVDDGTNDTDSTASVIHGAGSLEVGNRNNGTAGFDGAIDLLTFHTRALTSGEITRLYNAGAGLSPPFVPPPVADFVADDTSIIAGTVVEFTDLSTNDPDAWDWDFGAGEGGSSDQNPTHQYDTPGTFDVSLEASNAGGSDTETKTDYITVEAPVVADFHADDVTVLTGQEVFFTDDSTGDPTAWLWNFGAGEGTSTDQDPSHTYNTPGTFTVSLQASKTDPDSSDTETKVAYITVTQAPPVADFVGDPLSGNGPLEVEFTDLSTNDPTEWDWDFGDGSPHSDEQHPTHTYEEAGTFTVTLIATNDGGSDDEEKVDYIDVDVVAPVAEFSADPLVGDPPLTVQFTDESLNLPTAWLWNFGDGQTSTEQHPEHVFAQEGLYDVTLFVSNSAGDDEELKVGFISVGGGVKQWLLTLSGVTDRPGGISQMIVAAVSAASARQVASAFYPADGDWTQATAELLTEGTALDWEGWAARVEVGGGVGAPSFLDREVTGQAGDSFDDLMERLAVAIQPDLTSSYAAGVLTVATSGDEQGHRSVAIEIRPPGSPLDMSSVLVSSVVDSGEPTDPLEVNLDVPTLVPVVVRSY